MIDLRHHKPREPAHFQGDVQQAKNEIKNLLNSGVIPKSSQFSPKWKPFKKNFSDAQFGGKCAYCETRIRAGYTGDVEHIYPKAEVVIYRNRGNRSEDNPPRRQEIRSITPAFWWLAYEWENYVFSCNRCNNWKGSQFPMEPMPYDIRLNGNYKPLLLNPFNEDPKRHFQWNVVGAVSANTPKGKATIDVCGLDRKYLELERRKTATEIKKLTDDLVVAKAQNNRLAFEMTAKRMVRVGAEENPYAGMVRYLIEDLTSFSYAEWQQKYP